MRTVPVYKNYCARGIKSNYRHSMAKMNMEHCIGVLKDRFQCLHELRIAISYEGDIEKIKKITAMKSGARRDR
ncbi:unnamed protein product [Rhizopus stolonifer]